MTPSYLIRLLLLSSASFFLVQLVVAALIAAVSPAALRSASRVDPRRAARFLLTLRLLPAAFSILVVAALCVPSYLKFEPGAAEEEMGLTCIASSMMGALFCAFAISRTVAALIGSSRYVRACGGHESRIEGEKVWIVHRSAGLALEGILHPRLLISEAAMRELSRDQLAIALRHERAHRKSLDNLKRLLMLLAPPIFSRLRLLEQRWARCAEWAADDQAATGDADRSALADALVRVARLQARLQAGVRMPALVTSLVEVDEDLALRVDRLLEPPVYRSGFRGHTVALVCAAVLIGVAAANTTSLLVVHRLLERLLD